MRWREISKRAAGLRGTVNLFQRATDKRQALRDILTVTDFPALLRESHYADKFAQPTSTQDLKK